MQIDKKAFDESYSFSAPYCVDKSVKVFGFGGVGVAAVSELVKQKQYADICCVISDDAQKLRQCGCANKYEVKSPVPECGAVADPELDEYATNFFGDCKIVLILTCSCGCRIAASVAAAAVKAGKCCIALVTKPNKPNADEQIKLMYGSGAAVAVFDKADSESKAEAVAKQLKIAQDILSPVLVPALINLDAQDITHIFKGKTQFSYYNFTVDKDNLAASVKAALAACGANKTLTTSNGYIIQVRGDKTITLSEINDIISIVHALNLNADVIIGADIIDGQKGITVSIMA